MQLRLGIEIKHACHAGAGPKAKAKIMLMLMLLVSTNGLMDFHALLYRNKRSTEGSETKSTALQITNTNGKIEIIVYLNCKDFQKLISLLLRIIRPSK